MQQTPNSVSSSTLQSYLPQDWRNRRVGITYDTGTNVTEMLRVVPKAVLYAPHAGSEKPEWLLFCTDLDSMTDRTLPMTCVRGWRDLGASRKARNR